MYAHVGVRTRARLHAQATQAKRVEELVQQIEEAAVQTVVDSGMLQVVGARGQCAVRHASAACGSDGRACVPRAPLLQGMWRLIYTSGFNTGAASGPGA